MEEYISKPFGKMDSPSSISELLSLIYDDSDQSVYMWRGQANVEWPIHSGAYRRIYRDHAEVPSRVSMEHYEQHLLDQARHRGFDYSNGKKLCDLELLARLQHHGAATRLVDFSRNVLVALYFACSENPNITGSLTGSHTHYLGGHEGEVEERPYKEIVEELETIDYPATWQPTAVSHRIAAQSSQFLYSKTSQDDRGSLKIEPSEDAFLAIAISPQLKVEILNFLKAACDIHRTSIFPDLDGFASSHAINTPVYGNERW